MESSVYPRVKVRQEPYEEDDHDHDHDRDDLQYPNLKAFQSLSLQGSRSPARDHKDVSVPSTVKVPRCYIPSAPLPRIPVTEDFGVCSPTSDSSGSTGPEHDDNNDENKVHIRAGSIPRPRAVISSPDNDILIGNRNKVRHGRHSASKNGTVQQNRHTQCKVKSHDVTDIPPNTRKTKEAVSNDKRDPVGRKKVGKGSIKSKNVPRNWKF